MQNRYPYHTYIHDRLLLLSCLGTNASITKYSCRTTGHPYPPTGPYLTANELNYIYVHRKALREKSLDVY